jgi:hypothetical protein
VLTIAASAIAAVFFAVWNPERMYIGNQIIWP